MVLCLTIEQCGACWNSAYIVILLPHCFEAIIDLFHFVSEHCFATPPCSYLQSVARCCKHLQTFQNCLFSGSVVKPLWSMIRAWMTEGGTAGQRRAQSTWSSVETVRFRLCWTVSANEAAKPKLERHSMSDCYLLLSALIFSVAPDRSRAFLYFLTCVLLCFGSHTHTFSTCRLSHRCGKLFLLNLWPRILGQDPYGEFFVVADASVPLEDLWNRPLGWLWAGWHSGIVRFPCLQKLTMMLCCVPGFDVFWIVLDCLLFSLCVCVCVGCYWNCDVTLSHAVRHVFPGAGNGAKFHLARTRTKDSPDRTEPLLWKHWHVMNGVALRCKDDTKVFHAFPRTISIIGSIDGYRFKKSFYRFDDRKNLWISFDFVALVGVGLLQAVHLDAGSFMPFMPFKFLMLSDWNEAYPEMTQSWKK